MKVCVRLLAIITLSVMCGSCGAFYYLSEPIAHKHVRKSGYELCHLQSCGPQALSDAFAYFGINKSPFELGKEIQDDDHSHYRTILSVASHKFSSITCPQELFKFCKKYNFKITKKKNLNELSKTDVAIVLVKGRDDLQDWHWIVYPRYDKSNILSYFNKQTKIKGIYILNEKEN
jgi:hypothetical protein